MVYQWSDKCRAEVRWSVCYPRILFPMLNELRGPYIVRIEAIAGKERKWKEITSVTDTVF
jgi:hypothetical protein